MARTRYWIPLLVLGAVAIGLINWAVYRASTEAANLKLAKSGDSLAGDGWNPRTPTTRAVTPADVIGAWQSTGEGSSFTITFRADGTFQQIVQPHGPRPALTQSGTWSFYMQGKETCVELSNVLAGGPSLWKADHALWEIVESTQRPGQLAVFGGEGTDPDSYRELRKLPPGGGKP